MPYINQELRYELDEGRSPIRPGELNYVLTGQIQAYLNRTGHTYTTYNEVIGVLECAKLELYRRQLVPYEDSKKEQNGDVF